MAILHNICISKNRGTAKTAVSEVKVVEGYGLEQDAHGGNWHRQVSLISAEKIEQFKERGAKVSPGAFGENLIVEGIDFASLPVGTYIFIGQREAEAVKLKLTQVGKECHNHCPIFQTMGDCIMPRAGVFAVVVKGGTIRPGMQVWTESMGPDAEFTAAVITLSDKGAAGEREDLSGPKVTEYLERFGYTVVEQLLLADDREALERELIRLADQRQVNVIFTTGGTGFSIRDITPEATISVCHRMTNGIAEAIRAHSMEITPRAMFSRAVSGIRGRTLIVNLPGSPKAVEESLAFLLPHLKHGLGVLRGTEGECGREQNDEK